MLRCAGTAAERHRRRSFIACFERGGDCSHLRATEKRGTGRLQRKTNLRKQNLFMLLSARRHSIMSLETYREGYEAAKSHTLAERVMMATINITRDDDYNKGYDDACNDREFDYYGQSDD